MGKLLVVNLKKFGDVFQTGHLVANLKAEKPNTEVHVLCFEESALAAKVLKGIYKVHTINRKKLISFYKNNIYSDGLAFNEIERSLSSLISEEFTSILNYSNDRVSTYISSYLSAETSLPVYGVKFNSKNSIQYSSQYAIVLNDVLTTVPYQPVNFNDSYHKILGLQTTYNNSVKVKTNSTHNQTAKNNLNKLREAKSKNGDVKIVGIQIASASEAKNIPYEVLIPTIKLIQESENIIPILLAAPTEEERALAHKINSEFNNRLVSVEADFIALPSVLLGIDAVLSPDTSVKHLADLTQTPCIEVSLGEAPFLKQGSINPQSLIISKPSNLRVFKEGVEAVENVVAENKSLSPELIFNVAKAVLGMELNEEESNDNISNFCVYRPISLKQGTIYSPVSGPFSEEFELKRFIARATLTSLTEEAVDSDLYDHIYSTFSRKQIIKAINREKGHLSELTRDLLSTLRGLIQMQENKQKAPVFVEALERLLTNCFSENLSALAPIFFRAKLEALNATSMNENLKEVEVLLYELKDNLQVCFNTYKEIENHTISEVKAESREALREV